VGGGQVASRKVATLIDYGARVRVIAPELVPELAGLADAGSIEWGPRAYVRGDLGGAYLVICATDAEEVNRAVFAEADEAGTLVNVVDVPELCTFIVPSIVRRDPLQIAISTGGASPAISKRLRRRLESEFGLEWSDYVRLLGEFRSYVMDRITDESERRALFETLADSDLLERLCAGASPTVQELFDEFVGASK